MLIAVFALLNVLVISRLYRLSQYVDFAAVSYPQGTVAESASEQLKNINESGKMFSETVLWKAVGKYPVSVDKIGREETVSLYQMKGQPSSVFGKGLAAGRYFTGEETSSCLIDREAARKLFGSENVLGMKINWEDKEYQITGILEGKQLMCVIPGEKDTLYDGAAVRKVKTTQSSEKTFSAIETALGGVGEQRIDGHLYYMTACLLYFFAVAVLIIFIGIKAKKRKIVLVLCIVLAMEFLMLGVKVSDFGSDYLPPYWSEFEFFTAIFKEKQEQIQGLFHHQEFVSWQKMLGMWMQVTITEVMLAVFGGFLTEYFSCVKSDNKKQMG